MTTILKQFNHTFPVLLGFSLIVCCSFANAKCPSGMAEARLDQYINEKADKFLPNGKNDSKIAVMSKLREVSRWEGDRAPEALASTSADSPDYFENSSLRSRFLFRNKLRKTVSVLKFSDSGRVGALFGNNNKEAQECAVLLKDQLLSNLLNVAHGQPLQGVGGPGSGLDLNVDDYLAVAKSFKDDYGTEKDLKDLASDDLKSHMTYDLMDQISKNSPLTQLGTNRARQIMVSPANGIPSLSEVQKGVEMQPAASVGPICQPRQSIIKKAPPTFQSVIDAGLKK
jgi:hypothetical protein